MSLQDFGYSIYLTKSPISSIQYSSVEVDNMIESLSGSRINFGVISSSDGKTYFDLNNRRLMVNDGTNDRVEIGKLI